MSNHAFVTIMDTVELGIDLKPLSATDGADTILVRIHDEHASDSVEVMRADLQDKTAAEVVAILAEQSPVLVDILESAEMNGTGITVAGRDYTAAELRGGAPKP